ASLSHPNIAAIYGIERLDDARALVLELVEGQTLAERIRSPRLPVDEALSIARQIADALEAAHEKGVVHRDLKPANINITPPRRSRQSARFRPCQDSRTARRGRSRFVEVADDGDRRNADRRAAGDGRVHEPRTGARSGGGQARGCLGIRLRAVRNAHRPDGV